MLLKIKQKFCIMVVGKKAEQSKNVSLLIKYKLKPNKYKYTTLKAEMNELTGSSNVARSQACKKKKK